MKALRRFTVLMAALMGALALPAAVSFLPKAAAQTPTHTIVINAEGVEVPEGISAGTVTLTLDNTARAEAPAVVIIARLNDDQTPESFGEAMAAGDPNILFSITESLGGTMIFPGAAMDVTFEMSAGTYVIADFAREMPAITFFEVAGPAAEFTVDLVDFAFVMPSELSAGDHLVEFKNSGAEPHEFIVMRITDENMTEDEVMAALMSEEGDERLQEAFLWLPMSAGRSALVNLNLEPGRYVAACYIDYEGQPHLMHGMIAYFTVAE